MAGHQLSWLVMSRRVVSLTQGGLDLCEPVGERTKQKGLTELPSPCLILSHALQDQSLMGHAMKDEATLKGEKRYEDCHMRCKISP